MSALNSFERKAIQRGFLRMIKDLITQNWANVLILIAFAILLRTTLYLDKRTKLRMYALILGLFIFSLIVFSEFSLDRIGMFTGVRLVLMALRYSATPLIVAFTIYTLTPDVHWYVFLPAFALTALDLLSVFNGIIFSLGDDGSLERGPLGYLPYIMVGIYAVLLVYLLIKQSNKRPTEIIPIIFLCLAFASGLVLPFVIGKEKLFLLIKNGYFNCCGSDIDPEEILFFHVHLSETGICVLLCN